MAKLQEMRKSQTITEFSRSGKQMQIMHNFTGGDVILEYRGCNVLRSWMASQLQDREFQLTLPFRLGATSPL